ncbi:cytochrome P450 [Wallemia mellicola CBS 633.66]|uniref:Cytochrome P450 n=1 Tax=Wallemia mellicola (strain ATCC MYA-4683 / CBS 633.66) TaxID=671144 RepID=I4YEW0_WALMC|nr:cytochrome P450 [Wallemia mellicola CBS 633.66]EIM22502.1 cytochrome P450 [Wallemia mellicola CBS 633.66]|eukprot:XP_006957166.1 cytochrome P450 [Wallemia mellicola CBS 633.66]
MTFIADIVGNYYKVGSGVILGVVLIWLVVKVNTKSPLKNINGPSSDSWLTGHMLKLFDPNGFFYHEQLVDKYGDIFKYKGLAGESSLYVSDPRALQHILFNDGKLFEAPDRSLALSQLLFGPGVSGVRGHQHRKQRRTLNPVFAAGHTKELAPILNSIAGNLEAEVGTQGDVKVDILEHFSHVTLEAIGQCGLGYSFEQEGDAYGEAAGNLIPTLTELRVFIPILPTLIKLGPRVFRKWVVDKLPIASLKKMKSIVNLIYGTSVKIYDRKSKAFKNDSFEAGVPDGSDIMTSIFKANNSAKASNRLERDEILGMITQTSGALSRILEVLSNNKEAQDKLRAEIKNASAADGNFEHDVVQSLPYLEKIIKEVLRLFPPLITMERIATKDTVLPLSRPIHTTDGHHISAIPLKAGTTVMMGLAAANRSKFVWGEDAREFKPDRWDDVEKSEKDKSKSLPGVWSSILTFLGGTRACIGYRFALLEMKVILSHLIQTFEFKEADVNISWRIGAIQSPHTDEKDEPSLPLLLNAV